MKSILTFFLIVVVSRIPIEFTLPCLVYLKNDLLLSQRIYELNFTIYYLGSIIAQIFFGLLSDRIGRKSVLCIGIICIIIGTLYCALSNEIISFFVARFLSGVGGGIIPSMKRAILSDTYIGSKLTKKLSLSSNNLIFTMTIAPLLVSVCQLWFGWRVTLLIFAVFAIFCLWFVIFNFKETLNLNNKTTFNMSTVFHTYFSILRKKNFIIYSLCSGLSFGIVQLYMQSSNFIIIEYFKFSFVSYCMFFSITPFSYILGSVLIHYLCSNNSNLYSIYTGLLLMLCGSILGVLIMYKDLGGILYFVSILIIFTGCRVVIPNFISLSFVGTKRNGSASSLYGVIQMMVVFSLSVIFPLLKKYNVPMLLCTTFLLITVLIFLLIQNFILVPKRNFVE